MIYDPEDALIHWWPVPPLFLVDTARVNLNDLVNGRPGQIVRIEGGLEPPIQLITPAYEKLHPIEDEL